MAAGERILVIKLSALGDFIQALGPFAAIRHHNPDASITLLTTAPFAGFAKAAPWFDTVLVDDRPRIFDFGGWLRLRGKLRSGGFARIYDLQTSGRSGFYFRLFWPDPKPQWSGIARGCSHPHSNLERDRMHSLDRQREQLQLAGIEQVPEPDLSWINDKTTRVGTGGRYAILVPGGALCGACRRARSARHPSGAGWQCRRTFAPIGDCVRLPRCPEPGR
jgi:ADP-heptose:LPS heptosyltransferase